MNRSVQNSSVRAESGEASRKVLVPADTSVRVRLIEPITESSKPGDLLQGTTADPVLADSQPVIPRNTRALLSLRDIKRRESNVAEVTLQLTELVSKSRNVPVLTAPVKAIVKSMSDVDILVRGLAVMIGGAVGAARSASAGRDPNVGAAVVGGEVVGATTQNNDELLFRITEPIDLAGVAWW